MAPVTFSYEAYGLRVDADAAVPGFRAIDPDRAADLTLSLSAWPAQAATPALVYESAAANGAAPRLRVTRYGDTGPFEFAYSDGINFLISAEGDRLWCRFDAPATIDDAAIYLRGPVFGFVLRRRRIVCLHAAAVAIDGTAIAIVGAPGAGKSTTAAAFVEQGSALLSDDLAALDWRHGRPYVLPGCPRLHLWADAGAAVGHRALPRLAPAGGVNDWWDKRYRDLQAGTEFCDRALPLSAIYVLGDRIAGTAAPQISALTPSAAFMALTGETSVNYALDTELRAAEFSVLGRLVKAMPVRLVAPPDDRTRLTALTSALLADLKTLMSAA